MLMSRKTYFLMDNASCFVWQVRFCGRARSWCLMRLLAGMYTGFPCSSKRAMLMEIKRRSTDRRAYAEGHQI